MPKTLSIPGRQRRPSKIRGRAGAWRRLLHVPLLGLAAAGIMLLAPALASADTSSTLTVVGTSDVSDSGLIPNLIQPGFTKAYPKFTFKYIGTGTGKAIADAESGAVGASALIVHAASLENQFVALGYSKEKYGRALFINDFVLGGPLADPAGVTGNASSNVAQAFADVAAAGINGKATFVSRGGTPGTTVEEHEIWSLVSSAHLAPPGLLLCAVNAQNGGGLTPIAAGNGVTASGQACPGGGALPTAAALPKWYAVTGLEQGPNVQAANACNGFPSGANSCYVLTDRGTYDYLASGADPVGAIPALKIVSRDNSASAPGGPYALINYFHGYIINPSKPDQTVNVTAATDFLNYVTSPTVQKAIAGYLSKTSDPGGAPFKPTASPLLTASKFPANYTATKKLTIKGTLTNAQPGYPLLSGKTVSIDKVVGGLPVSVAHGRTDKQGRYSISFVPPSSGSYQVTTGQIAQIENSKLSPPFGDLLSPSATTAQKVTVHSAITGLRAVSQNGQALIIGGVSPGSGHVKAIVTISGRPVGSKKGYKKLATDRLAANDANFAVVTRLAAGRWQIEVKYSDPKQVAAARTLTVRVTVGANPPRSVSFSSVKVNPGGHIEVSGTISPSISGRAVFVSVLAMKTSGGPPRFGTKHVVKITGGKTKFTARFELTRGYRWILRLVSLHATQPIHDSGLRTINVR